MNQNKFIAIKMRRFDNSIRVKDKQEVTMNTMTILPICTVVDGLIVIHQRQKI